MNSEIDINVLVSVYNEKLVSLMSQNILLEAKAKSIIKTYEEEKNKILLNNLELQRQLDLSLSEKISSKKIPKIESIESKIIKNDYN